MTTPRTFATILSEAASDDYTLAQARRDVHNAVSECLHVEQLLDDARVWDGGGLDLPQRVSLLVRDYKQALEVVYQQAIKLAELGGDGG